MLQRENEQLVSDIEKMKKFNDYAETKKTKAAELAKKLIAEIEGYGISLTN